MRLEFGERLHPAQQLLSQCGRNIWTCEELFEDGCRPLEVVPYSNAHLEIVLKDTHKPHISRCNARCEFHELMRLRERSIKHLQPFFTLKNATGDIICCNRVDFYTNECDCIARSLTS